LGSRAFPAWDGRLLFDRRMARFCRIMRRRSIRDICTSTMGLSTNPESAEAVVGAAVAANPLTLRPTTANRAVLVIVTFIFGTPACSHRD